MFAGGIDRLVLIFGNKHFTADALETYRDALRAYRITDAEFAAAIPTLASRRFFPRPSDFLEVTGRDDAPRATGSDGLPLLTPEQFHADELEQRNAVAAFRARRALAPQPVTRPTGLASVDSLIALPSEHSSRIHVDAQPDPTRPNHL